MRGVDCTVPRCAHFHARTNDDLTKAVLEHAREKHPELAFNSERARTFVEASGYADTDHEPAAKNGRSWTDWLGRHGGPTG